MLTKLIVSMIGSQLECHISVIPTTQKQTYTHPHIPNILLLDVGSIQLPPTIKEGEER